MAREVEVTISKKNDMYYCDGYVDGRYNLGCGFTKWGAKRDFKKRLRIKEKVIVEKTTLMIN